MVDAETRNAWFEGLTRRGADTASQIGVRSGMREASGQAARERERAGFAGEDRASFDPRHPLETMARKADPAQHGPLDADPVRAMGRPDEARARRLMERQTITPAKAARLGSQEVRAA